jgi:hypothetical protein
MKITSWSNTLVLLYIYVCDSWEWVYIKKYYCEYTCDKIILRNCMYKLGSNGQKGFDQGGREWIMKETIHDDHS